MIPGSAGKTHESAHQRRRRVDRTGGFRPAASARQHQVHGLVRDPRQAAPRRPAMAASHRRWRPRSSPASTRSCIWPGSPVAVRWTEAAKAEIRNSRVEGTANLARAAAQAWQQSGQPQVLICGSAIGYYGSRGDEKLAEESEAGLGFLAEVCRQWESSGATGGDGRRSRGPHAHLAGAELRRRARWPKCCPPSAWEWPEGWAADASGGAGSAWRMRRAPLSLPWRMSRRTAR